MTECMQYLVFFMSKIKIYLYFWDWVDNTGSPFVGTRAYSCLLSYWQLSSSSLVILTQDSVDTCLWGHADLLGIGKKQSQGCSDPWNAVRLEMWWPWGCSMASTTPCTMQESLAMSWLQSQALNPALCFWDPLQALLFSNVFSNHLPFCTFILCLLPTWEIL